MKMYLITEKQLNDAIQAARCASNEAHSWCMDDEADDWMDFARELQAQGAATEHFVLDEKLRDKLVLELFKVGKYLDLLEATLSQYCENDAKEMLGNIWQCRDYMEVLLRQK